MTKIKKSSYTDKRGLFLLNLISKRALFVLFLIFLSLLSLSSKELKIFVYDGDINIALEGVSLDIASLKLKAVTDQNGNALINIDENEKSLIVELRLLGYERKRVVVDDFESEIKIDMFISNVIEGSGLTIEEKREKKREGSFETPIILDSNMISSSAMIGPIEDIMSSIKTLPGVSYSGKFNSRPSVRGGEPGEMSATLDGFLIRDPYHWAGICSIFDPNMLQSVKFSNGIVPVKYGNIMSGLIEAESKKPDEGLKFNIGVSTISAELFAEVPFWENGKKSGLLIGTRQTYLDPILSLMQMASYFGLSGKFSTFPYIRDGLVKWFIKPVDNVEFYLNVFSFNDGVGVSGDLMYGDLYNYTKYMLTLDYFKGDLVVSSGVKIAPKENIFIHLMAGYEFYYTKVDFVQDIIFDGMANYDPLSRQNTGTNDTTRHSVQSRVDMDFNLTDRITLGTGTSLIYDYDTESQKGNFWDYTYYFDIYNPLATKIIYQNVQYENYAPYMNTFLLSAYLNFNFIVIPDKLNIDIGGRLDYFFVSGESVSFLTLPVFNPRGYIKYTPLRYFGALSELSIYGGVGLLSKIPDHLLTLRAEDDVKDFQILQPQVLTATLGLEILLPLDFKIKAEGYYKFYFNRFYINSEVKLRSGESFDIVHSDGIGHAAGFDIMFQRTLSRYIDGWISYSFIFARYRNPTTDDLAKHTTLYGEPTGKWYYPSYHRFHNLSVVIDLKPLDWLTITPKFTFATGIPKSILAPSVEVEEWDSGTQLTRTTNIQDIIYSDTLRTDFDAVFDLKISFHFYFPRSKVRFETYVAVEDLFSFIFVDPNIDFYENYMGKDTNISSSVFRIPFPIPSIGIKVNF